MTFWQAANTVCKAEPYKYFILSIKTELKDSLNNICKYYIITTGTQGLL